MKKISIVTPCFNEEDAIETCYQTVKQIFDTKLPDYNFEYIFADNSSTDKTIDILKKMAAADSRVKVIVNSRNFGPMRSNFNAVTHASGDAIVVFLPADLQDPPDLIPTFVRKWEEGYKVVYGIRSKRQESFMMRTIRKLYYRIVSRLSYLSLPPDVGDFQLIDKQVLGALKEFDDYYPYLRGMIFSCGFKSFGIPYTWQTRKRGISKNNLYALIDQGLNGLISFSNVPMRLCMLLGIVIASLSLLYALVQLVLNIVFFREISQPGIATLIVGLFFFSGVQLFSIGIIGEYISAIHFQVRKRPLVIEEELINFEGNTP